MGVLDSKGDFHSFPAKKSWNSRVDSHVGRERSRKG